MDISMQIIKHYQRISDREAFVTAEMVRNAQFSCKQSIHKDLWDVKGNRTKGKSKESRDINLATEPLNVTRLIIGTIPFFSLLPFT